MSNTIPLPDPYGQITTHTLRDQQFFYRWPDPPYLDNAKECICVYTREHMHAHTAAVSADKDARIKVLEEALQFIAGHDLNGADDRARAIICGLFIIRAKKALAARAALGDKTP